MSGQTSELVMISRDTELAVSSSTGKITRLTVRGEELLVLPLPHERQRALTAENRNSFQSLDAWGGDECFPTVAGSALWNVRDHGDLWARTPDVFYGSQSQSFTGWNMNGHQFKRTISSLVSTERTNVLGIFQFEIRYPSRMPLVSQHGGLSQDVNLVSAYASHALFAAEPKDTIEWSQLPSMNNLSSAAQKNPVQQLLSARTFAENNEPVASKFYMKTDSEKVFVTSLVRRRLGLRIDVLQDSSLPWVGLWWCHNGWGDGRPHSTVGIEPTNLPTDGPVLAASGALTGSESPARFLWMISAL
ncbi:MAG: hypothetical protein EBR09_04500 [Proteobacteria bacterium]|nr:hypothetical protein [Pseudomonadota bacterium]